MFDPRDLSSDPRTLTPERPKRDPLKESQDRTRTGSRAEFDPRSEREDFNEPHRAGRGGDWHVSDGSLQGSIGGAF